VHDRAISRRVVLAGLSAIGLGAPALGQIPSRSGPEDNGRDASQGVWTSVDLIGTDGREISLGQVSAPLIIVHLWASWCAACLGELASLQEIAERLGPSGIATLLVSHPKHWDADQAFLQRAGLQMRAYTLAPGTPWEVRAAAFAMVGGSYAVPRTLVFAGSERRCVLARDGAVNWRSPQTATRLNAWLRAAAA
jgi:thiol-disulfide isomerase/thioredoxin